MKRGIPKRKRRIALFLAMAIAVSLLSQTETTVLAEEGNSFAESLIKEQPEESTVPEEITNPEETIAPEETTTPEEATDSEETTTPEEETTIPEETTISEETTAPEEETTIPEETITPSEEENTTSEEETTPEEIPASDKYANAEILSCITPEVTVKESYDTHLVLILRVPGNITVEEGTLYYAVKIVTHKSDSEGTTENRFYFEKAEADSQEVMITMDQGLLEEGQEWTYDISVNLVQTNGENAPNQWELENTVILTGKVNELKSVEVLPYYESKLTLKKGNLTIYTTQKNVTVATVVFGKKTTETGNLKVEDITYSKEKNKQYALEFSKVGADLRIVASADEDTALGKHTIRVTADAPEDMYAAQATITINVVQGIEDGMLAISTPSAKIYKAKGKAASLTLKAEYFKDTVTNSFPKVKKVVWEILSEKGKPFQEKDSLYGMLTVKNGKVTVNKQYEVSADAKKNRFIVCVTAADFQGNTACAYSEVMEITEEIPAFGEVIILKEDEAGQALVTARSEETITSDKLGMVRVLKEDAPKKESYTKEELEQWAFSPQYLSYKTSNTAVKIGKDGSISATKPAKNVKITVLANDKSGQKAELGKLTIAYKTPDELALKIEVVKADGTVYQAGKISAENTDLNIQGAADTRFLLTIMQKNKGETDWKELDAYADCAVTVKNGKILRKSGEANQYYMIYSTKETISIKLNDKAAKRTITYEITNDTYPEGKTPKLSTKDKLKAVSYPLEQSITYTLKKNGNFEYDYKDKYVMIMSDNGDKYKSESNEKRYCAFETALEGNGYIPVSSGNLQLKFTTDDTTPLPAGSYKLWFTFGTLGRGGVFQADTKALPITIKVQTIKVAKGSYKPVTSVKIAVKEGGTAELTGKGKQYLADSVQFSNLKNANVDGRANAARTYFELDGNTLKVKDNLSEEQLAYLQGSTAKKDLTAYVDYQADILDSDGTYCKTDVTVKITITMAESVRQFSLSKAKASNAEETVKVTAYANKQKVNIMHAVSQGSFELTADGTSTLTFTPKTGGEKPKWGVNNLTVYLVPEGTYAANEAKLASLKKAWEGALEGEKATARAAYEAAVQKYGIKIKATVELPTRDIPNREQAEQVVALVNKERKAAGLNPLTINEDLMYAASIRAKETAQSFSHTRPDGRSCFTVLSDLEITYHGAGENIACGYQNAEAVMNGWMNSPGHRSNILNGRFTQIGVGCYESNGRLYWTQIFILE